MAWGLETWSTSQVVTAAEMTQGINANFEAAFPDEVTSVDFDPVWDTTGSGFAVADADGATYRLGPLVFVWARARVSTVGTGLYFAELQDAAAGLTSTTHVIGSCFIEDNTSSANNRAGVVLLASGSPQEFHFWVDGGRVGATYPFTLATNDVISFSACYPAA